MGVSLTLDCGRTLLEGVHQNFSQLLMQMLPEHHRLTYTNEEILLELVREEEATAEPTPVAVTGESPAMFCILLR